jgi:uncharacterized protein with beta-barrel porin domain
MGSGFGGGGGADSLTSAGGTGASPPAGDWGGGGGGGAGATGGNGGAGDIAAGSGGIAGTGGSGATSAGASGTNGGNGLNTLAGGGGGGGGAHGFVGAAAPNAATGGNGGAGGNGSSDGADGGGGGAGGYGAVVTGSGTFGTVSGTIQGGSGGAGGTGFWGGDGGTGGVGLAFSNASGGTLTLGNGASIKGGNGGAAGAGSSINGNAAVGGTGIVGQNLTVITSGTIQGGLAGNSVTRANAIAFTGGTNVLELQAGSTITGNVVAFSAADTLRLGGANNSSFDVSQIGASAQYRGFGIYQKTGSSTWTLSGTNTAALPWAISTGTLNVNGTMINSTMTVNNGGTLAGTGTVGNVTVAGGGTLAPGSGTPGTSMTIAGNLAFQSGALYLVQVNPATASSANVSGTATLTGASVNAQFASGSYVSKQYTILTATGGRGGTTFASLINTNLPANFHTSLSYDANNAYLNLLLNFIPPPSGGLNQNQQNVANAIVGFFNSNGGIPIVFGGLTPAGLSQLSGEVATGSQQTTFNAMGMFMGLLTDPFIAGRAGGAAGGAGATPFAEEDSQASSYAANHAYAMFTKAPPAAPFEPRWSVWAAGFGGSQTTDGNAAVGSNSTTSRIAGTAVGADYRFSPFTIAGFALAGGGTNFSVANALGSGRSDLFQAGAYVYHTVGPAYVSGALAYGWQDITTNRTVTVAGLDQLRAEFNANAFSGRAEGGYRFVSPWMGGVGITPYAAGQFTTFDLPAYAEQAVTGANTFALAYGAKSVTDTRSELGLRSDKSFAMQDGIFTLRGRVAWAHDFNPDRNIGATFQTLPGASFVVGGAAQASDSALITASAEKKWLNGWSAAATFEGEFSGVTTSYAGKGVVRYSF